MPSYNHVTRVATKPRPTWTNKQVLLFHYHNPNGGYAAYTAAYARLRDHVAAGKCKSGALLAFDGYSQQAAIARLSGQQRIKAFHARYHGERLAKTAAQIDHFIATGEVI